jgi:hypothetical protein
MTMLGSWSTKQQASGFRHVHDRCGLATCTQASLAFRFLLQTGRGARLRIEEIHRRAENERPDLARMLEGVIGASRLANAEEGSRELVAVLAAGVREHVDDDKRLAHKS